MNELPLDHPLAGGTSPRLPIPPVSDDSLESPSRVSPNRRRKGQGMDESPTERGFRERIDALGPEVRALLLNVLNLADEDRVARIGELWADERTRLFAELLIDVEEDIAVRAFVISELKRARV